ncbi:MBL fold metallo-hydrolase [Nocardioides massiliensis]|uniref:L-ascorbate metabolism protein UlaG (Beta-lactamase superfamily) n=1 Tax=Nocardioides massiliensis TaxID=1325935 RepID=A0ABT9NJX7_9ACTN|nr:MBL fold metallo-hydrolase [Nocardioides massiliensis]MDP9820723.1 L-ascorbate metabolism protein UlaG (beta-lactamase superfamily) [Nocardioides massiliensis]
MRITKFGHSCVRLEAGGSTVVLDPGGFTDPEAVDGADAVLVTHEHFDHVEVERLRRADADIWTHAGLVEQLRADAPDLADRLHVVETGSPSGAELTVAGFTVRPIGEWHAVIHDEIPRVHNVGYVLTADGTSAYHPGDALTEADVPVDVLLLPATAPWSKVAETIDFARAVGAPLTVPIHEAIFSEPGRGVIDTHLQRFLGERELDYRRVEVGQDV